jgi:hypothetical protein
LPALAALALLAACRPAADPSLWAYVPTTAVLVIGADVEQIRETPFYRALSLDGFPDATLLLLASDGKEMLLVRRGKQRTDPTVSGAPGLVAASTAQRKTGSTGAPKLLARAPNGHLWAVARGGIDLPLPGNAASLNRLFRLADYVTFAATANSSADLELTAHCRTADAASHFEETLRGLNSLASIRAKPELAALLNTVRITREGLGVHATLSTTPEAAARLLGAGLR